MSAGTGARPAPSSAAALARPAVALSRGRGASEVATELLAGMSASGSGCPPGLVLVFAAEGATVAPLTAALSEHFGPDCLVLGCSSAGSFTFDGYDSDCTIAIAFPATAFSARAIWLSHLRQHMALDWMSGLRRLSEDLPAVPGWSRFGLLLIDGMSGREELVTATVDAALPELLVLGGSAGDGLRFGRTWLAMNGEERLESALFCLISTEFAVEEVVFDHFLPRGESMVVTDADPEARLIHEINAEPAALEYSRLIGLSPPDLSPRAFAENPLLERTGGRHFVRAISSVTEGGALKLLSAVESGTLLTVGRPESLTEGLRARMEQIGPAELVLGFDCILRRIAVEEAGEQETVGKLCHDYRIAGFNTYGEQHGGIHVNQTFVGLALLAKGPESGAAEAVPRAEEDGAADVARR